MKQTKTKKIWLTLIFCISLLFNYFSSYIYTTEPGLHFLVVLYDSAGILILNIIAYQIIKKRQKLKVLPLILVGIAILTALPTLIDARLEKITLKIGFIISVIGILIHLFAISRLWIIKEK